MGSIVALLGTAVVTVLTVPSATPTAGGETGGLAVLVDGVS